MTYEKYDQSLDPLDFGITLLDEVLRVFEDADFPLVSSYVQLALDLSQAEAERRKHAA